MITLLLILIILAFGLNIYSGALATRNLFSGIGSVWLNVLIVCLNIMMLFVLVRQINFNVLLSY